MRRTVAGWLGVHVEKVHFNVPPPPTTIHQPQGTDRQHGKAFVHAITNTLFRT